MRSWLARLVAALWLLPAILCAGESPVSYSKFCVTCGILGADTIASLSGQFVVHGSTLPIPRALQGGGTSTNGVEFLVLSPQTVAITAERVRNALADELRNPALFHQKVHVVLMPLAPPEQAVTVVSRLYRDGVVFQVGMPARIDHTRFIKVLVQVLLSDFASSRSGRVAEIPGWVVEGMAQRLFARVAPALVANRRPLTYEITGYDRLHSAREVLSTNTCLTFHELSFPGPMNPAEAEVYRASAHLFLAELMKLPGGAELFTRFVASLSGSLNWQTTFYQVYGGHFQTALDVEKWWALSWVDFRTRQGEQTWPLALSLEKLAEVLLTSIQIRTDAETIPSRREVSLQEFITTQDFPAQQEALTEKLRQMFFLQFNMPEQSRNILGEYHSAVEEYLQRRAGLGVQPSLRREPEQQLEVLIRSTIRRLDELDQRRESLRLMAATP